MWHKYDKGVRKMKIALQQIQGNPERSRRIAVSSTGKSLESRVAEVFGRCPYFVIAEIEDNKIVRSEAIENTVANQIGGAGISAAQAVVEKGVSAVIAGNIGPRALDVLRQFDIEVYKGSGLVENALQEFVDGKLTKI
jgi:predicted Fe-Mo cluster-binding NifX family protein